MRRVRGDYDLSQLSVGVCNSLLDPEYLGQEFYIEVSQDFELELWNEFRSEYVAHRFQKTSHGRDYMAKQKGFTQTGLRLIKITFDPFDGDLEQLWLDAGVIHILVRDEMLLSFDSVQDRYLRRRGQERAASKETASVLPRLMLAILILAAMFFAYVTFF